MNLIEALKSGRRFKRKGDQDWRDRTEVNVEAILAEDWEIEARTEEVIIRPGERFKFPAWVGPKSVKVIIQELSEEPTPSVPDRFSVTLPDMKAGL